MAKTATLVHQTGTRAGAEIGRGVSAAASSAAANTSRHDHVEALAAQITEAVAALTRDGAWATMLRTAARLAPQRYSLGNLLLIATQYPEATYVAGYRTWQSLGRQVLRGQRAIRILAPVVHRTGSGTPTTAPSAAVTTAGTAMSAESAPDDTALRVVAYRPVAVFDISQTEGAELALPDRLAPLAGDAPAGLLEALTSYAARLGYAVQARPCATDGVTDPATRTITVRADRPGAHTAVTLAHELAHVLLHTDGYDYRTHRGMAEVEAESIAFVVATAAGIEAAEPYSAGYLATWSGGDVERLRAAAATVVSTSRVILDGLGAGGEAPARGPQRWARPAPDRRPGV